MQEFYRWDETEIESLMNTVVAAHTAVFEASLLINTLTAEMADDPNWGGEHRNTFLPWMDLLRQYVAALADGSIGPAATAGLNQFLSNLRGYYESSPIQTSLGTIT